jgi:hypothetical protein
MVDTPTGNVWQEHEAGYQVFAGNLEKPDFDERSYRILELKNGLKAVLVHDPLADKSAACLRVAVGSLYDPVRALVFLLQPLRTQCRIQPDMYGTAHFCEHMITKVRSRLILDLYRSTTRAWASRGPDCFQRRMILCL